MKSCANPACSNGVKARNQYCSKSCAAKVNNTRRSTYTDTTRAKLRDAAIRNRSSDNFTKSLPKSQLQCKVFFNTCKVCNELFTVNAKQKLRNTCSDQCYQAQVGGYRPHSVRGKGQYVSDSYGNQTYLQSSYEVTCANLLSDLNIKWVRPDPLPYKIGDKSHLYYPDFWLPEHQLFLDPKNAHLIPIDAAKISAVQDQNDVDVIVLTIDDLQSTSTLLESLAARRRIELP